LILFALLLIGFSMALGQLSFAEQARISVNFGFAAIHLSAVVLSIFLGSTLVYKEIEKRTVLTLLVRPISRLQLLFGKSMGLVLVIMVLTSGLAAVLATVAMGMGLSINGLFFLGLLGVLMEALVLLGVTLFFSSFARPIVAVSLSIGFFLIGHWIDNLAFFAARSKSEVFFGFSQVVVAVFPNLEKFNWRSLFIYDTSLSAYQILVTLFYAFIWSGVLISAATLVIRRRDFV
jgi:ABC-type transport system involved in multi-copper enzyme maturation permease subunit